MITKSKVGRYDFVAEPFHTDFTGRLSLGVLGNHMLNSAGFHSSERGFGISFLQANNYTWVLSRFALELNEMPADGEAFCIETWVENAYRLFTDRNFAVLSQDGQRALGYARSVWAMIDLRTRKPVDLLGVNNGNIVDYAAPEKSCPIEKPGRIKVVATEPARTIETFYSDVDINGHVNSMKYIEHIMDLFSKDFLSAKRIARFEIAYVAESYWGDHLSFFCDELPDDEYAVEIRKHVSPENPVGEVVCRSKLIFCNK